MKKEKKGNPPAGPGAMERERWAGKVKIGKLKPCPFCGEDSGELLAYGPSGSTRAIREVMQCAACLRCGAEGPVVKRIDGIFTAAREAWNKRARQVQKERAK